jgi:5-methylthioadenosine/S-adenosylhomocysteine deaminase
LLASTETPITLIRAAFVLPMTGSLEVVHDGAVAIGDERILAVGPWELLRQRYAAAKQVGDGRGILLPGLVNVHTHFSEALLPSLTDQMNLFEWLKHILVPGLRPLDREKARIGTLLKGCELLRSGVTTVSDMFVHYNPGSQASLGVVDGLEEIGLRGVVCFGAEDKFDGGNPAIHIEEHWALKQRADESPLVSFCLGIGTLGGQSETLLRLSLEEARRQGWRVHTHLAEVREELTEFRQAYGCTPIKYAAQLGLLDLDVLAAHCIWLTEEDFALLQSNNVAIAHNPVANMYLGSGVCQVPRMLRAGMTVGLGTDGAASNNNQNMFGVLKTAALLQKLAHLDAAALEARAVVEMATLGGARALGLDHEIGTLEVSKRADLVLLNGNHPALTPIHDPYQQLVYSATGAEVTDVWVNGRHVLVGGRVATVTEEVIVSQAHDQASDIIRRSPALQAHSMILGPKTFF